MEAVGPVGGARGGASNLMQRWCMITCEYPPMAGGVSDHSMLLARSLAAAGDEVDVWCPPGIAAPPMVAGVRVQVLPSLFGLDSLRLLREMLRHLPRDVRVLVQYVPTGFGWRMMNVPFALLLYSQRRRGLDVYFHEVGFPLARTTSLRRNLAGVVHLAMNWLVVRSATRILVAIPEWQQRLRHVGVRPHDHRRLVTWVPVPSNVPDVVEADRVAEIRAELLGQDRRVIVGHFGTSGRYHLHSLPAMITRILDDNIDRVMLLVGRDTPLLRDAVIAERPALAERVVATGGLEPADVSIHLAACDVLLQPFDDGVSSRRGSLMAGLALGRPIVTNEGVVTGPLWRQRGAVLLTRSDAPDVMGDAVNDLLADAELRTRIGAAAVAVHEELFALERGVTRLRNAERGVVHPEHQLPGTDAAAPASGAVTTTATVDTGDRASTALPDVVRTDAQQAMPLSGPRVFMFHTTLPTLKRKPGGVEIAVHRLANALVDLGTPVTVGSLTSAPADARYVHRRLFTRFPWLVQSTVARLGILPLFLNFLGYGRFDVVHFHGDDWFVVNRPRASIRTLHGSALREAQRATSLRRRLMQYAVFPLERLAAKLATISVAVGEDAASLHGIRRVIANGVDHSLFHPGEKAAVPTILYVGTWEGRKRGRWLYERFLDSVVPRHPDAVLHFIADVPPPSHPRVRFERFPDDAALARAYREAWVFALPSTYEGFGIPYLEAMASGTVVLATPNVGASELLGNGRFGVLAEDGVYTDALLRLLGDDAVRARIAGAGLAHAQEFSWQNVARAYQDVYDDALRLRHHAPPRREAADARATDGVARELRNEGPRPERVGHGEARGLTMPARRHLLAAPDEDRVFQWLGRLLGSCLSMVDVGSADGSALIYALSRGQLRAVLAFEPDRARRETIRRLLAPNGLASDPRLSLRSQTVGVMGEESATLDSLIPELRWPVLVRIAASAAPAALAGAEALLQQDSTRWLVGVSNETRPLLTARFEALGYRTRGITSGLLAHRKRWIAAWRHDDRLVSE